MNLRKHLTIIAAAATAVLAGTALPASAAPTATTFALTGGALTLSVQPSAALTNAATSVDASTITGLLGLTSVNDERGGTASWNVSVISTAFTGPLGSSSSAVSYTGGVVAETGTITVADGIATGLSAAAAPVISPSAVSGNNTAAWDPSLSVTMPAGALADSYSGTVTTSIA